MEADRRIDLRDYVQILRRRWWAMALIVLVAVGSTYALSSRQNERYVSTAQVLIRSPGGTALTGGASSSNADAQRAIANEIRVVQSRQVQELVAEQLGYVPSMSVDADSISDVVSIQASGSSGDVAAQAANVYADAYIEIRRREINNDLAAASGLVQQKINDIDGEIAAIDEQISGETDPEKMNGLQSERNSRVQQESVFRSRLDDLQIDAAVRGSGAIVVNEALPASDPVSPTPRRDAFLALVLSGIFAVGVAIAGEFMQETVRTPREVEGILAGAAPIVGRIPNRRRRDRRIGLIEGLTSPRGDVSEAYRGARSAVLARTGSRSCGIIQITSATDVEERSSVTAGLALGLVSAGVRVVVVCADLRSERLSVMLQIPRSPGFAEVIASGGSPDDVTVPVPSSGGLSAIASGAVNAANAEVLAWPRAKEFFSDLRERFDAIIIDGPPVIGGGDSAVLAGLADLTILVVEAGTSRRRDVARTLDDLAIIGAAPAGVILTNVSAATSVD
jgi:Mrp family chromosome partitioning ATPase/capsular polysaccharide biosynthesis protein